MNILKKHLKKRKQPQTSDDFEVVLKTEKILSEKQKNTINRIVEEGIILGNDNTEIAIKLMMYTQIYDSVIITRINNGVVVFF